jgi:hypothetical protein
MATPGLVSAPRNRVDSSHSTPFEPASQTSQDVAFDHPSIVKLATPVEHVFQRVEPTGCQTGAGVEERNKVPGCLVKPTLPGIARSLARLRYGAYLWVAKRDCGGSVGACVVDKDDFSQVVWCVLKDGIEADADLSFPIERGNDGPDVHDAHDVHPPLVTTASPSADEGHPLG